MTHAPLALTIPLAAILLLFAVPAGMTSLATFRGSLDRRGRLGLTTPAARASDEAFTLANRVAAPLTLAATAIGIVCAVLVLALPLGIFGALVVAVVGGVGVLAFLGIGSNLGERVARTVPLPARKRAGGGCCGGCGCGDGGCAADGADAATSAVRGADIPDLVADATVR